MGAMPDLTLNQISAKCTNKEVAKYIASMPPLPEGIGVCKFLAILLYSARKAILQSWDIFLVIWGVFLKVSLSMTLFLSFKMTLFLTL
ncbi:MAG: hypothetical protein V7K98_23920 [Nostoc sp.]|uniref:hypothetical protein n=1 Tax=Nostoc sp. TaxID=1180 RepID=UPI002FF84D91